MVWIILKCCQFRWPKVEAILLKSIGCRSPPQVSIHLDFYCGSCPICCSSSSATVTNGLPFSSCSSGSVSPFCLRLQAGPRTRAARWPESRQISHPSGRGGLPNPAPTTQVRPRTRTRWLKCHWIPHPWGSWTYTHLTGGAPGLGQVTQAPPNPLPIGLTNLALTKQKGPSTWGRWPKPHQMPWSCSSQARHPMTLGWHG